MSATNAETIIGISISREETFAHRPQAENMQSGLAGACAGFAELPQDGYPIQGVAIYAAWEADDTDWKTWEAWLEE